jgi:hypothetical protein
VYTPNLPHRHCPRCETLLRLPEELAENLCEWCSRGERCQCGRLKPATAAQCDYCDWRQARRQMPEPQPSDLCSFCRDPRMRVVYSVWPKRRKRLDGTE